MKRDDVVIESLRWIKEMGLKGNTTTGQGLLNHLIERKKVKNDEGGLHKYVLKLHTQLTDSTYDTQPGHIKLDAYLALLDHDELELAREESINARRDARNAIYVAVGLGIIQLIFSSKSSK